LGEKTVAPNDFFSEEEQEAENRREHFTDGVRRPERLFGAHFSEPETVPQVIVRTSKSAKAPLVVFVDVPDPASAEQQQIPQEQTATQDAAQAPVQRFVQAPPQDVVQTPPQDVVQTPLQSVAHAFPQEAAQEQPRAREDIQKTVLRQALNREQIREQILQNSQALKNMPASLNDRVKAAATVETTAPDRPKSSEPVGTTAPDRPFQEVAVVKAATTVEPLPHERLPVTPITLPPIAVSVPAQTAAQPGSELSTVIAESRIIPAASAPVAVRPLSVFIDANRPKASNIYTTEPLQVNEDWAQDFENASPSRIARIKERLSRKSQKEEPSESEDRAANIKRVIFVALRDVAIVIALFAILLQFFSPTVVNEHSMENTFVEKDILFIANKAYWFGEPNYNDIIIFDDNGVGGNKKLVKRVIGLPGDTILIAGGTVFRNGVALDELYTKDGVTSGPSGPLTVPEDSYYVLGDNREVSRDSRSEDVGFVSKDQLAGKVIFRLFPLNKFGFF
jgi:signal peptidase I